MTSEEEMQYKNFSDFTLEIRRRLYNKYNFGFILRKDLECGILAG